MSKEKIEQQVRDNVLNVMAPEILSKLPEFSDLGEIYSFDTDTALNGSILDYNAAKNLYRDNQDKDALDIIDNVLGVTESLIEEVPRLRTLMRTFQHYLVINVDPTTFRDLVNFPLEAGDALLGPGMIHSLLILRSQCLAALGVDPSKRNTMLLSNMVEQAEVTTEWFPEDIQILNLAAQMYLLEGDFQKSIEILDKSASLDPEHGHTIKTLGLLKHALEQDSFEMMTSRAIEMSDRIIYEAGRGKHEIARKLLQRMIALVDKSLDLSDKQADAWAAKSWAYSLLGEAESRDVAIDALNKAKSIDPENRVAQIAEQMLAKTEH